MAFNKVDKMQKDSIEQEKKRYNYIDTYELSKYS